MSDAVSAVRMGFARVAFAALVSCLIRPVDRVSSIDPQERIGTCLPILNNVTTNIFANEGVWFPQYRALESARYTKGNVYSCHIQYEKVYFSDTEPLRVESDCYYTLNGEAEKNGYTSAYYKTSEKGKLQSSVHIDEHGDFQIFNYFLEVTPEFRVRYVCTDYPSTIAGVAAVYIETRGSSPKLSTIKEAHRVLLKHNLKKKLVKINQKNCKRPINMNGYVPQTSDEKQKNR